jgi:multiple sugar transport system permease protein
MSFNKERQLTYAALTLPALGFLFVLLWPLGVALHSALTDAVGNFSTSHVRQVYSDSLFLQGLQFNVLIPVVSVALEVAIGLSMAIWFYHLRRGKTYWRTIAIVPFAVPEIVYLLTMKLVFRQHGYLNSLLLVTGGDTWTVGWLRPESPLLTAVVILVDAWRVTPVVFLIVLAALEQMPESYVEAARVDGATWWQVTRFVQVPLVVPALMVALALRMIDAFRIFATPFVLVGVQGLPVLTSLAYHYKMEANDPAAANVASLTLAFGLLLISLFVFLITTRTRKEGR